MIISELPKDIFIRRYFDFYKSTPIKDIETTYFDVDKVPIMGIEEVFDINIQNVWETNRGEDWDRLNELGNSQRIRTSLIHIDNSDIEAIKQRLINEITLTYKGYHITYSIRLNEKLIGLVELSTPLLSRLQVGYPKWLLEFYMLDGFEGKGYMYKSLNHIISNLSDYSKADEIFAIVNQKNTRCIHLLDLLGFFPYPNEGFHSNIQGNTPPKVFVKRVPYNLYL